MEKIMISILMIGMLLITVPLGIVGQETVNEEQSFVEESFYLENNYFNRHIVKNGDSIEYKSDDDSVTLPRFVPGELIVKFKDNVQMESPISNNDFLSSSVSSKESANIGIGVDNTIGGMLSTGLESIDQLDNEFNVISIEELFPDSTISYLSNIYKLTFPVDTEIIEIMSEYNSDDNVVYAEPNYLYTTSYALPPPQKLIPNDPLFNQQWALNQTGDRDIDAPEAWNIKTGDSSVVIAIVDTGVDYNHPDLAANIWHDPINGNPGYDFVDINTAEYIEYGFVLCPDEDYTVPDSNPMDVFGHGTHCAGIASAVTNNSIGIAGVCWNCKIMPVKSGFKIKYDVYTTALVELDDIINAIVYAADKGADVISMSYGGYFSSNLEKDALNYAYSKDVVLVAAAGNENINAKHHYPAGYENVISVAATDNADNRAFFSNYGESVDVAAPGVDILSTLPNGAYDSFSGTSMACPHVAGLAALILSKNYECPYPAQMVQSMIPFTTDKIDTDQYIGTGRINAYKALVRKPFAALLDSIPNWEDVKGTIDITGAAWGENFQYYVLEDSLGENPSSWTEIVTSSTSQSGILSSLDTTQLDEGLHTIRLKVVCSHGAYTDEVLMYVNNQADGSYDADIYVSNCFDSSTPGWGDIRFSKIQDGIDHAGRGDTIFVYDGIYPEDIDIKGFSKSVISLIGQNKKWAIIDGGNHKFNISSVSQVIVSGFTIRERMYLKHCSKCIVSNNIILLSYLYIAGLMNPAGCYTLNAESSSNNIISNNIIGSSPDFPIYNSMGDAGIFGIIFTLHSSHNMISNNTITCWCPIDLDTLCNGNTIKDNIINSYNSVDGWGTGGVTIDMSNNNMVESNSFKSQLIGISLGFFSLGNTIIKNNISMTGEAGIGIDIEHISSLNKIIANEIKILGEVGFTVSIDVFNAGFGKCKYNKIYYNNCYGYAFDNFGKNSTNEWYKYKIIGKSMGNYWNDYTGVDGNGDGIGDTPYDIGYYDDGINMPNQDKYPVIEPFDGENINVNSEMTVELNSEESQYLTQVEEMINNQILAGELNTNDLMNSYVNLFSDMSSQSQQSSQQGSTTQQSTTGSSTTSK